MQMRLLLALPALALLACQDDPPAPQATQQPPAPPQITAPSASASPMPPVVAESLPSAAPPPAPSAAPAPSASSATSTSAAKPKPDPSEKPPNQTAKKETTPTLTAKPVSSADAPPAPPTSATAASQPQSPADAIAAQIDTIFVNKKTFSAKFKQEHTQKVAGVTKKSTGVFFFERPNKMSFRYDLPSKNRIVSDGSELKVYIGEDNQMFVQSVDKTEYPGAFAFLMGKGLGPSFSFAFHDKSRFEGGPVLLGKPREATPHYDSIFFYVDKLLLEKKDPGVMRRILIVDAQGNRNRFDLEEATQPDKIDPAEFTFTPPAGTNITKN